MLNFSLLISDLDVISLSTFTGRGDHSSLAMVHSPYEWNILDWDENKKTNLFGQFQSNSWVMVNFDKMKGGDIFSKEGDNGDYIEDI